MAIPRAALLGIVGAVLIAAAFFMMRSRAEDAPTEAPTPVAAGEVGADESAAPADASHAGPAGRSPTGEPSTESPADTEAPVVTLPVARALGDERVLVLLFTQGGGAADDRATHAGVRQLRDDIADSSRLRGSVSIITDRIANVGDYRGVIGSLGVAQAPSIVIVERDFDARLLEGFTDYRSLRQHVADASG